MALTIVETPITGGVDTHADVHVAAALDPVGGLLGVAEFPVTPAGYARLPGWLGGFGSVCLAGIEGTGSYGAGLARHLATAGIRVVEVDRSAARTGAGKASPTLSTPSAPPGPRSPAGPAARRKAGTAPPGAIRALMADGRSARAERTQTINQARSLIVTGPDDLRIRFAGHTVAALVAQTASLRPRPGSTVGYATRIALRELGRRAQFPGGQLERATS
jgi:transposase